MMNGSRSLATCRPRQHPAVPRLFTLYAACAPVQRQHPTRKQGMLTPELPTLAAKPVDQACS